MNLLDFDGRLASSLQDIKNILHSKAMDYGSDDIFSCFKKAADLLNVKPELVIRVLIAIKFIRINNLINSNRKPDNESIEDSIKDLTCYSILLKLLGEEDEII